MTKQNQSPILVLLYAIDLGKSSFCYVFQPLKKFGQDITSLKRSEDEWYILKWLCHSGLFFLSAYILIIHMLIIISNINFHIKQNILGYSKIFTNKIAYTRI